LHSVSVDTSAAATFFEQLQTEFKLPPHTSRQILQVAQTLFHQDGASPRIEPEETTLTVASLKAPPNMPLDDTNKVDVVLIINNGPGDAETRKGKIALRQNRILRLQKEAMEQGGILTQKDLAQLLDVDIRTIRRDIQALQSNGQPIETRGTLT